MEEGVAEEAPTEVNDLSPACFVAVFSILGAAEAARAMCVHPLWAEHLRDDILWRPNLLEVYARAEATLPDGAAAQSFRAAFLAWTAHYSGLDWRTTSRALHMWARLSSWLQTHAPFISDTLRGGATAAAVAEAEATLGLRLPHSLVAVIRAHDGQELEFDRTFDRYVSWRMRQQQQQQDANGADGEPAPPPPRWHPSMVWGLFGGYSFYDHLASLRLFPLERIVRWTQFFWFQSEAPLARHLLVCGASANLGKLLLLDTRTGDVRLGQAQDNMPAAPAAPEGVPAGIWGDGLLRWMEEWVRRLQAGWYEVGDIGVDRHKAQGVVLFPVVEPNMAMAVTRGLQVRVSSVFAPEMCGEGGTRYFFSYSVRFCLLPVDQQRKQHNQQAADWLEAQQQRQQQQEQDGSSLLQHHQLHQNGMASTSSAQAAGVGSVQHGSSGASGSGNGSGGGACVQQQRWHPLCRCQLESRQWRILSPDGELANEVAGEGVIGQYPLLEAGGPEFVYQSCTHQAEGLGFMEGGFEFVEGTLARPEGPSFTAVCPRFELRVPDYIF